MCKLAVSASNIGNLVEHVQAVMLRALRSKYPKGSRLLWVCGDDVFDWISNEKGQAMLAELDGLIVQRRLHKACTEYWTKSKYQVYKIIRRIQKACDSQADRFYKAPVDSDKVRALVAEHRVHVDFIYGELPHYSSTLVRNSPASWRAFLPQKVAAYLDDRPALLAQLVRTGDAPASRVSPPASPLVVLDKNMLDDAEPGYQEDLEFEKELTDAAEIMLKTSSLELEVLEDL
ncbi:Nicotinamide-nucleotide adenylyltransferase [Durusdinium trenchii]|uniref:Nicotinamide-nucleotide adenylyltransferase n=1 Tax=Durusdinium trenchii TaxID=1381693 RepID=A0ABP0QYC7_9DINO